MLSRLLDAIGPRRDPPGEWQLVWVLLSPSDHFGTESSDAFINRSRVLARDIDAVEGVLSVTRLENTSPGARRGSIGTGPKACPVSLLVRGNGWLSPAALIGYITHVLDQSTGADEDDNDVALFSWSMSVYKLIQQFESPKSRGAPGGCTVAVAIEPAAGQSKEVDTWYRKEHLLMLATNAIFLRCSRYERLQDYIPGANNAVPRFLALHEYLSVQAIFDHAIHQGALVLETDWTRRILDAAKSTERSIWSICDVRLTSASQMAPDAADGEISNTTTMVGRLR